MADRSTALMVTDVGQLDSLNFDRSHYKYNYLLINRFLPSSGLSRLLPAPNGLWRHQPEWSELIVTEKGNQEKASYQPRQTPGLLSGPVNFILVSTTVDVERIATRIAFVSEQRHS